MFLHSILIVQASMCSSFPCIARVCKPFKEPRNQFPAWRPGTTSLFVVPGRLATKAGGIESSESILGLLKRLQIRALYAMF